MPGGGRLALGLLLALALLAGCSLGPQRQPDPVTTRPSAGGSRTVGGPSASPDPGSSARTVRLFLVRGHRVVAVRRRVAGVDTGPAAVLALLTRAPSESDREAGLRSALAGSSPPHGPDSAVLAVSGVVRVELPAGLDQLPLSEQVLALGQLVFTLTANAPADAVVFTSHGRSVAVPDGLGRLRKGPVGRADYARIAPR